MRIDPALRPLNTLTFTLLGGPKQPEFTGRKLQSCDTSMCVSLDSPIPAGTLFLADSADGSLLGEVVACRASAGRWEASLLIHSRIAREGARMDADGPETVLPDLLALNVHLLKACVPNPGTLGARLRQA